MKENRKAVEVAIIGVVVATIVAEVVVARVSSVDVASSPDISREVEANFVF